MSHFLLGVVMAVVAAATTGAASYTDDPQTISFDEGYSHLFGGENLIKSPDGRSVRLKLDRYSGSGFISTDAYQHGFFSASIKLPRGYTAGVVVAFYIVQLMVQQRILIIQRLYKETTSGDCLTKNVNG